MDKELTRLKKEKLLLLTKKLLVLTMGNIIVISSLKASKIGYPYVLDKEKKYKLSITKTDNYNNINKIEKYIDWEEERKYKNKNNLLYIKDNYNDYCSKRDVKVYNIKKDINYKTVINNYQDYSTSDNLVDCYTEQTNNINKTNQKEIIVKYYSINKDDYIEKKEDIFKNILASSLFTIISLFNEIPYIYYSMLEVEELNNDIKNLKKKK